MSFASSRRRPGALGSAGTTSLEMAVILSAFLVLLLGITDVARYLMTLQSVDYLATTAARAGVASATFALGSTSGSCPTVASSTLPFTAPPFLDPATTLCVIQTTATGGTVVTAQASAPFVSVTPVVSAFPSTITTTVQLTH